MRAYLETCLQNFDPREPLLQRWALDLIDVMSVAADPGEGDALIASLITPEFLAAVFAASDTNLISKALAVLPAACFRPMVDQLVHRWEMAGDTAEHLWGLARVLAKVTPERAAPLFETAIRDEDRRHQLPEIVDALRDLHGEDAHALAHALMADYETVDPLDAVQRSAVPEMIFQLAWRFDHPRAVDYIENYIAADGGAERHQMPWHLFRLAFELGDAAAEFHMACDRLEKRGVPDLRTLVPFYDPSVDLDHFEAELERVRLRRYTGVPALVAAYALTMADRRLASLLSHWVKDTSRLGQLLPKRQRPYLYALIIALLLRSQRREAPDFRALSTEAALDIVGSGATLLPNQAALEAWLMDRDPDAVANGLLHRLAAATGGPPPQGIIQLAGRLRDERLVDSLLALPLEDLTDGVSEAAADEAYEAALEYALGEAGGRYFDAVARRWDALSEPKRLMALRIAGDTLHPQAAPLIEAHFEAYWHLDRERLLTLCPLLGVDCRRHLEPYVRKHQPLVDETWLTLALLHGDRSETVDALLNIHQAAVADRLDGAASGGETGAMPAHPALELACRSCGASFVYRLARIWINPNARGDYYPAEEFACLACHQLADFRLTEPGRLSLGMHLMGFNLAADEADYERLLTQSPFEFLPRIVTYGGETRIEAALARCRQEIGRQPEDPAPLLALGNMYVTLDHRSKARHCYEAVVTLAPDAIEAYLMLAQMAIDEGAAADALTQLRRGDAYLAAPRLLESAEISRDQVVALYRTLLDRLDQPAPDLSDLLQGAEPPVLRSEKVGRNAPCPCGSGKKYKRCCLADAS